MDWTKKYDNQSPEESANFLSKLFYCWVLPFFKFGYRNDLHIKNIYNTTKPDLSGPLGDVLERNWNAEVLETQKTKGKPSLERVIVKTFAKTYMFYGIIVFLNAFLIKMSQPILLGYYIRHFEKKSTSPPATGWWLATGIVALAFMGLISMHYTLFNCNRIGMRVRIACCSLMYRKLLRLNHHSLGKTATGQLINLMSNDVARFDVAMPFLHYIWIMPLQAMASFGIMYSYIDLAAIPAMVVMILQAIFGQGYLSRLQGVYRGKIAGLTDQRIKIMSEVTSGIQVIKMYAWEKPFEKVVKIARRKEVDMITRTSYIKGFFASSNIFLDKGTVYIAVISFVLLGHRITGEIVFSIAQLLNTIQLYMSIYFPLAYSAYEEAKVSIRRIEEFLVMEENPAITYPDNNETG